MAGQSAHGNNRLLLSGLRNEGGRLLIDWADSHESCFPAIALRASCQCELCGSYRTAHRNCRLTDVPAAVEIAQASLDDGGVEVTWRHDNHVSRFDAKWLRANCNSPRERAYRRWRPHHWTQAIESELPSFAYERCIGDESARLDMLEALRDYGFAIVSGAPLDPARTESIAGLVGPLRDQVSGKVYDVRYNPDPEYYADTRNAIAPHTDGPYRHSPPAITCFHFITAATSGGESTLTDAFRIGADIKARDAKAFELLARIPVTFHRRLYRRDKDYRIRAPIFCLDEEGEIAGFRLLDRAIGPVDAAQDDIEPFYVALRMLLEMLYDESNQAAVPMQSGDVLFFNNHRVMHGRQAFDPQTGRHMRSCNIEIDEFNSSLRFLADRLGREGADMVLPHGALT